MEETSSKQRPTMGRVSNLEIGEQHSNKDEQDLYTPSGGHQLRRYTLSRHGLLNVSAILQSAGAISEQRASSDGTAATPDLTVS